MPRRNSLIRRFLQHRAWDEWDEHWDEGEGWSSPRWSRSSTKPRSRDACAFGAALRRRARALRGRRATSVRSLFEDDSLATPAAAQGASGAQRPDGRHRPLASTARGLRDAGPREPHRARGQAAPLPGPSSGVGAASRTAVASSAPTRSTLRPVVAATATKQRTAVARTHTATSRAHARVRAHRKAHGPPQAPKAPPPPLDPEVHSFSAATVWLNRAAAGPDAARARLKLGFARSSCGVAQGARQLGADARVLRAEGHNGRAPGQPAASARWPTASRRSGGPGEPWAAMFAFSSDTTFADRSSRSPLLPRGGAREPRERPALAEARPAGRLLNDSRVVMYSGGRHDIDSGRVDVRVLATDRSTWPTRSARSRSRASSAATGCTRARESSRPTSTAAPSTSPR